MLTRNSFYASVIILCLFSSISNGQDKNKAFVRKGIKWPSNTILVSWINPKNSNIQQRKWVEDAIRNSWEKESNINLVWCDNEDNDYGIRILIDDDGPHTLGLGKELDEWEYGMLLNFDFRKWKPMEGASRKQIMKKYEYYIRVIAIHEFGHALGFEHEQKRQDCPTCDDSDQSIQETKGDGDWWTSTCDMSSVMNYCNPRYANNGVLSRGDIEGIRTLYGPPVDLNPSSNYLTARLVHTTSTNEEENSSTVNIYLSGDNSELERVDKVTYFLDERFEPNMVVIDEANDNFGLEIELEDAIDFRLNAEVLYSDGKLNSVQRYINFEPEIPGEIDDEQIKIDASETELGNDRYLFGFSVSPNSEVFDQIVRVQYTRDHKTFSIKTLTADNPKNNFKVEWDGWGCLPIEIKIFYIKNDLLHSKEIIFDMCEELGWN